MEWDCFTPGNVEGWTQLELEVGIGAEFQCLRSHYGIPGILNPSVEFLVLSIPLWNSQCFQSQCGILRVSDPTSEFPMSPSPLWNSSTNDPRVEFPVSPIPCSIPSVGIPCHDLTLEFLLSLIPLRNSWYHQSRCAIPRVSSSTVEFQCHGSQSRIPSVSNPLWNSLLGSHVVIPL